MKKWFVGLLVLLTLVLAQSTVLASEEYYYCSHCQQSRPGTTEDITDPNDIETTGHNHTNRIFTCSVCSGKTKIWASHYGGGATCTTKGKCVFCHVFYKNSSVHSGPKTYSYSKTDDINHDVTVTCTGCQRVTRRYSEEHDETKAATCTAAAYCGRCRSRYGEADPNNHVGATTTSYAKTSETQHTEKIKYSGCGHTVDGASADHTETTAATCQSAAYCAVCESSYGEADLNNHVGATTTTYAKTSETQHTAKITYADCEHTVDGESTDHTETTAATCTAAAYCAVCESSYGEIDPDAHDLESHGAQAPTCTEVGWEAYQSCTREGCAYTTYQEIPALGHDGVAKKTTPATCTAEGYTTYTCTRCGDSYRDDEVPALQHWYAEWTPNGDATHAAPCKRDCDKIGSADCAAVAWAVLTGEVRTEFTLCPVCGEVSEIRLIDENGEVVETREAVRLLLEDAAAEALTERLPAGEIVVRMGELESGELLMSVAFEISGELTQPTGQVKITLPAEALSGHTLAIIEEDGTETPIELEIEEDTAAFTLDFTESQTPVALLRLLPQA